jgi:hypothetical protein
VIENIAPLSVQLINSNGLNVKGTDVIISLPESYQNSINIYQAPFGDKLNWDQGKIIVKTGKDGKVNLNIGLNQEGLQDLSSLPANGIIKLTISAKIDEKDQTFDLPIKVFNLPPLTLTPQKGTTVHIEKNQKSSVQISLLLTDSEKKPVKEKIITANLSDSNKLKLNDDSEKTQKTDEKGEVNFTIESTQELEDNFEDSITFTADVSPRPVEVVVTVTTKSETSNNTMTKALPPTQSYTISLIDKESRQTEPVIADTNSSS